MSYREIVEGWYNHIFDTEAVKEEAQRRATICSTCPLNKANICSRTISGKVEKDFIYKGEERKAGDFYEGCGCPLSAKTKSPNSQCPLGLWVQ
jgi:hypothetical protein